MEQEQISRERDDKYSLSFSVETLGPGSAGVVDQFTLRCVQESHLQLSLLTDLIVELHSGNSLSEDELMEVYNPASVYSEVGVV